ncbi:MAG: exonuclease [Planctomyces sp.]|nr:exonuclease [Planctomyces sp.]
MFKFIHAADIHLDSPLKGLERYEGAPVAEIRNAARRALENLVRLAIDEEVKFVLISGDLYDGDWRDFQTGFFFIKQASRLREAGIPLFLIAGNHDAANKMTRSLRLPENVHLFPATTSDTVVIDELEVALHGQSFQQAAVTEDLSKQYPAARSGYLNIGLLHTSCTGREGHEPYAPCTIEGLTAKGYDYWALGHVHTREVLCESPYIVFPGNIQGRHARETGAKGCYLVTVDASRSLTLDFRPLDVLRWEVAAVDVSSTEGTADVLDLFGDSFEKLMREAGDLALAVRVELTGQTDLHQKLHSERNQLIREIQARGIDAGGGNLWIEKVKLRTSLPARSTTLVVPEGAVGEIRKLFESVRGGNDKLLEYGFDFEDVFRKLPEELKQLCSPDDPEWLESVVTDAESLLMGKLYQAEEDV